MVMGNTQGMEKLSRKKPGGLEAGKLERYELTSEIRKSVVSIPSNIAEEMEERQS